MNRLDMLLSESIGIAQRASNWNRSFRAFPSSGTILFIGMKSLLFVAVTEFQNSFWDGFITDLLFQYIDGHLLRLVQVSVRESSFSSR
ncbi:MAG: hypothetical protein ACI4PV_08780 [Butyricicoccus sp.]